MITLIRLTSKAGYPNIKALHLSKKIQIKYLLLNCGNNVGT